MLNKYIWNLYKEAGGQRTVDFFEESTKGILQPNYPEFIARLQSYYCAASEGPQETRDQLQYLVESLDDCIVEDFVYEETTLEELLQELRADIEAGEQMSAQRVFDIFSGSVPYYTTHLFLISPDLCVPYYFIYNFNILQMIADEFGIELPEIPSKKDYNGRYMYYGEICKALHAFREANELSVGELCAFLYEFAPHYIGGTESYIIKDLPAPKSAFFIGGAATDEDLAKESDLVTFWQGSPETQAGDMIVMYLRTPVSGINSIWRSVSIGFNDPFFYWYRCIYIGQPVKTKTISLKDIQKDKILSHMPIVRKNMQGINGVEIKPSEYKRVVELSRASVPVIEYAETDADGKIHTEKDVENLLIKPLLSKLGYDETDYVQQMYVAIGNHNNALIPDFVLYPTTGRGHESGFAIIEAKRTISNDKALEEVKVQARSYAKLLHAFYAVIASQEKVWLMEASDDYNREVFAASWAELNDPDVFHEAARFIGPDRYHG